MSLPSYSTTFVSVTIKWSGKGSCQYGQLRQLSFMCSIIIGTAHMPCQGQSRFWPIRLDSQKMDVIDYAYWFLHWVFMTRSATKKANMTISSLCINIVCVSLTQYAWQSYQHCASGETDVFSVIYSTPALFCECYPATIPTYGKSITKVLNTITSSVRISIHKLLCCLVSEGLHELAVLLSHLL